MKTIIMEVPEEGDQGQNIDIYKEGDDELTAGEAQPALKAALTEIQNRLSEVSLEE